MKEHNRQTGVGGKYRQTDLEHLVCFCRMGRTFVVNKDAMRVYDVSSLPLEAVVAVLPKTSDHPPDAAYPLKQRKVTSPSVAPATLNQIVETLRCLDEYEADGAARETKENDSKEDDRERVAAFCVFPTYRCNMRCVYCFGKDRYLEWPQAHTPCHQRDPSGRACLACHTDTNPGTLTEEKAEMAIDWMLRLCGPRLMVGFFGGEPMLEFGLVKHMVERLEQNASGQGKEVSFNLTTNGSVISDEQVSFLRDHGFSLIVSFDAVKRLHDKNRPFAISGKGSYDVVFRNLTEKFLPSGIPITVRATAPLCEMDFDAMGRALLDTGALAFSIEPARAVADAYNFEDYCRMIASLQRWARTYVSRIREKPFHFFYFGKILYQLHTVKPLLTPCGAGVAYLTVAADGSIWPCQEWVENPYGDWQLGSVEHGITRPDLVDVLRHATVENREWCKGCWAKWFCGGSCLTPRQDHEPLAPGEQYFRPSRFECDFRRDLLEISCWVYSEIAENAPEALDKLCAFVQPGRRSGLGTGDARTRQ